MLMATISKPFLNASKAKAVLHIGSPNVFSNQLEIEPLKCYLVAIQNKIQSQNKIITKVFNDFKSLASGLKAQLVVACSKNLL